MKKNTGAASEIQLAVTIIDRVQEMRAANRLYYYALLLVGGAVLTLVIGWGVNRTLAGPIDFLLGLALALIFDLSAATYTSHRRILNANLAALEDMRESTAELQIIRCRLAHDIQAAALVSSESEYLRRVLADKDYQSPLAALILQSKTGHSIEYIGKNVKKNYLSDLQKFIQSAKKSYFTLQPGLPFFDEHYWFFSAFHDSLTDCVRVVTHNSSAGIKEDAEDEGALREYAYQTGRHTRTLWCLRSNVDKAINRLTQDHQEALKRMPIEIEAAVLSGDLVICDHRVVLSFAAEPNCEKGELRFFLADDKCSAALAALADSLAPQAPEVLEGGNEKKVQETSLPFRLQSFESIQQHTPSRPFAQKEFAVDLKLMMANAKELHSKIQASSGESSVNIRWMLKADAYGLGAAKVIQTLFEDGFRHFAFGSVSEAMIARAAVYAKHGSRVAECNLLVTEPIQAEQIRSLLELKMSCFVWTKYQLQLLNKECESVLGKNGRVKVHLKVDVGLHRFGMAAAQLKNLYNYAQSLERIVVEGIAAHHFATRPSEEMTKSQEEFESAVEKCLLPNGTSVDSGELPVVHSRSSGSLPDSEKHPVPWNVECRIGGALFGVFPNSESRESLPDQYRNLRPAVSLKALIEAFVRVKPSDTVSYGGTTYQSEKEGVLGWINLGYSDGLPTTLLGQNAITYHGKRCPVIGVVGMNFTAVDVSAAFEDMKEDEQEKLLEGRITSNEEVWLIGGGTQITVEKMAKDSGIPPYSLLTALGKGNPIRHLSHD